MTRFPVPVYATAQNRRSSGDQQTEFQLLSVAEVRDVQVIPSGLVMTRFPVPVIATAQNSRSSGDQQTEFQLLSAAEVRDVQVIPSGLVMTRSSVPVFDTAQNRRSSGDQQTPYQLLSAAEVREYHCRPVPSHGVPPHPRAAGKVTLALSTTEPCHESPHALALASAGVNDRCGQE